MLYRIKSHAVAFDYSFYCTDTTEEKTSSCLIYWVVCVLFVGCVGDFLINTDMLRAEYMTDKVDTMVLLDDMIALL